VISALGGDGPAGAPAVSVPDRRLAGMADLAVPAVELTPHLVARREAVSELGEALRELVGRAVGTEVPVEVLLQVAGQARKLSAELAAAQREREQPPSVDDLRRGQRMFNPVVGPGNPLAPPLRVEIVDGAAIGTCTLDLAYEGPFMFAHGGISALLLDQIMGYATAAAGHPAVTGRLHVRYRGPVPLRTPLRVHGKVVDVLGSRVAVRGTISALENPAAVLVEAEGRFMTLRKEQAQRLFGPAVGSARTPRGATAVAPGGCAGTGVITTG
jgi:acyl-coenzyme A thioesterase PaaI-like protein